MIDRPFGYGSLTRKTPVAEYRWLVMAAIALAAILFRVYAPQFFPYVEYLRLPLLVTVYFSMMRRSPILGVFYGMGVGLAQDALSAHALGIYGIVKTLVGYFAASVSQRFDVERQVSRMVLAFFFLVFHQLLYWILRESMLGQTYQFDLTETLVLAVLNAVVAAPLFHILDKLRIAD